MKNWPTDPKKAKKFFFHLWIWTQHYKKIYFSKFFFQKILFIRLRICIYKLSQFNWALVSTCLWLVYKKLILSDIPCCKTNRYVVACLHFFRSDFLLFFSYYDPPTKKICLNWSLKAQRKNFFFYFCVFDHQTRELSVIQFFFDAPWLPRVISSNSYALYSISSDNIITF